MLRELNWGEPMQFSAVSQHLFPMVKEVCEQKGSVAYTDRILCKILMLKDEAGLPLPPQSNDIQASLHIVQSTQPSIMVILIYYTCR